MIEPAIAASSPVLPAPAIATELTAGRSTRVFDLSGWSGESDDVAVTLMPLVAWTDVRWPATSAASMYASVLMSNRTFTTIEMPTPTSPVVAASESARLWRPSGAVAFTVSVSLESSVAPLPTDAMVSYFTTWTASEPATAFCD